MSRLKLKPTDGLGPYEKRKLRNAIRMLWHRSHARKLAVKRATDKEGFPFCELCGQRTPKVYVDHIIAVGELNSGFIKRMFAPSKALQCLCKRCHDEKTKAERKALK